MKICSQEPKFYPAENDSFSCPPFVMAELTKTDLAMVASRLNTLAEQIESEAGGFYTALDIDRLTAEILKASFLPVQWSQRIEAAEAQICDKLNIDEYVRDSIIDQSFRYGKNFKYTDPLDQEEELLFSRYASFNAGRDLELEPLFPTEGCLKSCPEHLIVREG